MRAPLTIRALYADIELHVTGPDADDVRADLESRWTGCRTEPTSPSSATRRLTVRAADPGDADGTDVVSDPDRERLPTAVTHAVTQRAIESGMGRLLMLHAAGLADPGTGATVVCVARGGTGKTTLCRTLGPGRRYLTDETVGITPEGVVVPYPKPLSVRRDGTETKDELSPTEVGLRTSGADPWLAAIVLLRRDPEHVGDPQVEELDLFDAILAVSEETSSLAQLPRPLQLLADLVEHQSRPVLAVTYAEAGSLEGLLSDLVGAPEVAR